MELRHIQSFLALTDERHFGRAAARVHIAQSALSQQIRHLERELGVELFARTTRRVDLTDAGRAFEVRARAISAAVRRAETEAALLASGHAGRVAIGFVGTATYDVLPLLARRLREELPEVELDLHGEMLNPDLIDGSRRLRIANGSGTSTPEVNQLLRQFSEVQRMMKRFGIGAGGKRQKKKGKKGKGGGRVTAAGGAKALPTGPPRPELKLPGLN